MLALWCLIAQEQEKISIHHYLHVILTSPSWGLSVEKTKYHKVLPQKTMGQKCSLRCFIGRYFPSVGWVSIVFRILHNHFTQPKGYVAQIWPSPEYMPGWSLVGDRLVSFDAVVWAISTPAFFSLEVHDYLPGKQNYKLLTSTTTSSLIRYESCWQGSLQEMHHSCWLFCLLAHCRKVTELRVPFLSFTACVITYT